MKFATTLVSALAVASALTAAPVLAQETTHMINGKAVSALQLPAVQTKCDELRAGAAGAANATTAPAAQSSNAGAAGGAGGADNNPGGSASDTDVDIANLTIAQCDEGGFTPKM